VVEGSAEPQGDDWDETVDEVEEEEGPTPAEPQDDIFPPGWQVALLPILAIDALVVVASLVLVWNRAWGVSGGFWFAGALVIVVFLTFGGMLSRTGSMRASLAGTLFLTFLVLAIFVLNIAGFTQFLSESPFSQSVFQTLTAGFTTVLVFYFGSEAYITATKEKARRKKRKKTTRRHKRATGGGKA
jgi:hypothetical protein